MAIIFNHITKKPLYEEQEVDPKEDPLGIFKEDEIDEINIDFSVY
jgi:hypothetical protein